jgi:hypothetical protein
MTEKKTWFPGHFPLAAGRTLSLEPRTCGVMQVAAGRLVVADKLLAPGDKLRLWRGDAVDVANVAHTSTAFFAWDACDEQPSVLERVRQAFARLGSIVRRDAKPGLASCGDAAWCLKS